jgi:ABC-type transport system involved in multi-copper enzyme maturation permease subunit
VILTQTFALLVDAYRELNARKLFWVTLALSLLVVAVMAASGINERGITFLIWTLDFIPINSTTLKPEVFYKGMFSNLGIGLWLSWVAAILALISTAGVIPDLVSSGAIETVLSKPISRIRLFLTKYLMGLLFVALQVLVFSLGSFLVFGLRAGLWEPRLFLAVPIVVIFFSYLFSVCSLVGLLTRSTTTSLLATLVFWFVLFVLNSGDAVLMQFRVQGEAMLEAEQGRLTLMEKNTAKVLRQQRERAGEPVEGWEPTAEDLELNNPFLRTNRARAADLEENLTELVFWSDLVYRVKTALPKTTETIALLERNLIDLSDIPLPDNDLPEPTLDDAAIELDPQETAREVEARLRERSTAWVLGTSLAFEGVVLAVCCLVFARRDF